jgi:hypothetical protein
MFAARPATLVFSSAVCLVLSTLHALERSAYVRPHLSIAMVTRLNAHVTTVALPRRLTGPITTVLSPWKIRRKAVLEQSDPTAGQECDLGPASLPNDRSTLSLGDVTFSRLPCDPPLRC